MFRHLLILIFVSLIGCSTTGIEITGANNHINTPHYSITVPPNSGWYQNNNAENPGLLNMSKTVSTHFYMMGFKTKWVVDENMKSWTAKQLADAYRAGEQNDMERKDAMNEQFELHDVVMGEEKVGNKKFYTMNYIVTFKGIKQNSFVYLHFPKVNRFSSFLFSIYTEEVNTPKSFKNEFLATLNSVEMAE